MTTENVSLEAREAELRAAIRDVQENPGQYAETEERLAELNAELDQVQGEMAAARDAAQESLLDPQTSPPPAETGPGGGPELESPSPTPVAPAGASSHGARESGAAGKPFPLDSFREAAPHLRRPFTPEAVRFKVQAAFPKGDPKRGLIVAYIDARLVVERLNLIVPHLWSDEYEPRERFMLCRLTVDGITRQDIGELKGVVKGLYSDALKRAAVKFGVGVSLYAIPKMILDISDGHVKQRDSREGKTLEMTPAGEKMVRSRYETWLHEQGIEKFGEPLDHGDVENAQGDPDAAEAEAIGEPEPPAPDMVSAINAAAAEARMPSSLLANVILTATGNEAREWAQESEARGWVVRALEKLPDEGRRKVLAAIEAPE